MPHITLPSTYRCAACNTDGVRLWREYQTWTVRLYCFDHASTLRPGREKDALRQEVVTNQRSQFGWLVPAVLVLDALPDANYWGYTSIPDPDFDAWKALPL